MDPERDIGRAHVLSTFSRRVAISGAAATGFAAASQAMVASQATPQATPETDRAIDAARLMNLSTDLCGGARLKEANAQTLLQILNQDESVIPAFEEVETITEFNDEAMKSVSPEGQRLAANILQYWFLGRYNGEPVDGRAEMFFDLACWQTLPYSTQPSTCKSFGYWAVEIEL